MGVGEDDEQAVETAQVVVFVGLAKLYKQLTIGNSARLHAIQESDVDAALQTVGTIIPNVVVVDAATNDDSPVDFAAMCRSCHPDYRKPIITVDLRNPAVDITINEWSSDNGAFYERSIPLRFLKDELRSALKLDEVGGADPDHTEVQSLGRNEFVKRDGKMFNIQTEVRVGKAMTITTQIFEGGAIVDNTVQNVSRNETDVVKKVSRIAGMQHYEAVAKVRRGRLD